MTAEQVIGASLYITYKQQKIYVAQKVMLQRSIGINTIGQLD